MEKDTLLPVRIKSGRDPCIGDEQSQLSTGGGFTKVVVHATAESIIKCPKFKSKDQRLVASCVDPDLLEFDDYQEEVDSRFGRPLLQIIQQDGLDAYEALDNGPTNAYLHAALYTVPVFDAAQKLDVTPSVVVETDEGPKSIGKSYGRSPNFVSATIEKDGELFETDLREFVPELDWVIDNWRTVGGNRKHSTRFKEASDAEEQLEEYIVDDDSETHQVIINEGDRGFTIHRVKGVEESIAADEDDRIVTQCGIEFREGKTLLEITDPDKYTCGSCY